MTSITRASSWLQFRLHRLVPLYLQMSFMAEELGLPDADVRKILIKSPKLLSYGVESMRDKQCYLEEGLQLGAKDVSVRQCAGWVGVVWHAIRRVCVHFCFQPAACRLVWHYLSSLHFTPVQVSSLVSRCPQLLGYGVDSMESKVVFLEKVGGRKTTHRPDPVLAA